MTEHHGTYLLAAAPIPVDTGLKLPVTATVEPLPNDLIMQYEVFGPCWSVLKVQSVGEAMKRVASMPSGKPLVSHYYGQRSKDADAWQAGTSSGSLAINSGPCAWLVPASGRRVRTPRPLRRRTDGVKEVAGSQGL